MLHASPTVPPSQSGTETNVLARPLSIVSKALVSPAIPIASITDRPVSAILAFSEISNSALLVTPHVPHALKLVPMDVLPAKLASL